jgi:hypothetical protein
LRDATAPSGCLAYLSASDHAAFDTAA